MKIPHPTRSRRLPLLTLSSAALLAGCGQLAAQPAEKTFDITLTDLTSQAANSGQPFSPPVFVTHDATLSLYSPGAKASVGVQNIAEGGNRDPLVATLQPQVGTHILTLATPLSSPLVPGSSVTVRVKVDAAHPLLSHVWMLGRTNDGFGGQNSLNLYDLTGTHTYTVLGMDAGTEKNSEKTGFLGALGGGNARDPEDLPIAVHEGITGRGDAPTTWNWNAGSTPASANPVASVTVTLVNP